MEMNDKKSKALQQALQEFEDFKKGKTLPAIKAERAAAIRTPHRADKMLYCATRPGFAAQMILKIEPGTARIAEVCKLHHKRSFETLRGTGAGDNILRTHKLDIDNYSGCPHCGSPGIAYCSKCHTLSCLGPDTAKHCCPCCGYIAPLQFSGIDIGFPAKEKQPKNSAVKAITKGSPLLLPRL